MLQLDTLALYYLVGGLAVYRLAFMLVFEEGMFGVAAWIRTLAGVYIENQKRPNPFGQMIETPVPTAKNWFGKGLTCFNCTSVWVAALPALFISLETGDLSFWQVAIWFAVHTLAISGFAMLIRGISNQ